jgi:hypothetical protein
MLAPERRNHGLSLAPSAHESFTRIGKDVDAHSLNVNETAGFDACTTRRFSLGGRSRNALESVSALVEPGFHGMVGTQSIPLPAPLSTITPHSLLPSNTLLSTFSTCYHFCIVFSRLEVRQNAATFRTRSQNGSLSLPTHSFPPLPLLPAHIQHHRRRNNGLFHLASPTRPL